VIVRDGLYDEICARETERERERECACMRVYVKSNSST
jgi:hypothetical protein